MIKNYNLPIYIPKHDGDGCSALITGNIHRNVPADAETNKRKRMISLARRLRTPVSTVIQLTKGESLLELNDSNDSSNLS